MIDLLDNYAENCKNSEHQTVFEIAQCNEDFEAVYLMYDYILERRKLKIKKNLARARDFLSTQPNFSLEMKWDVKIKIPLVSYFCPNDVCKIWKYDRNVRLNYSFAEFKNLNCIRIPSSWYFIGGFTDKNTNLLERKFSKRMIYLLNNDNNNNNKEKTKENNKILQKDQNLQSKNLENHLNDIKQSENKLLFITEESNDCQIIQANWMKNIYFNPHEEFEEDEKNLIREDIMANRRIHGEFKLKNCVITESLSGWSKKPVIEKVNGLNAKKYEVSISAFVDLHNKEKFYYEDFIKEDYFNEFKSLHKVIVYSENKENTKKNIADNFKVKNDKMRAALMKMSDKKEKKLKAYVWIAENFPIKSSSLTAVMDSVSSANEFTKKIKEFLNDKEIKRILDNNGFPIKITIPVNWLIDVTVNFTKYMDINSFDEVKDVFKIPDEVKNISRKDAQRLDINQKKRIAYANIQ